ncbi:MAG: threonine ammonia-lyase [Lentimicrobiaceae bacterium]|nr:threonine ammonia-lyase [Lentimicrobiaceae bacterium]
MDSSVLKFSDIVSARSTLRGVAKNTTLLHSKSFSRMADANIYLKLENMQTTGAFKVRGAYNKLANLSQEEREKGVVAASAGNHAQGVAFSATKLGMQSTIFMPIFTPPLKVLATKGYGANVVLMGDSFDDAFAGSQEYAKEHNATYIHPFNDPLIIAGQGTIGLEVYEQIPDVDAIIVPIGGGGLIAGIAMAIKEMNPKVKVIGVNAAGAASMVGSLKANEIITLPSVSTIADGIAVKTPGNLTFDLVQKYVDDVVTVTDTEIAHTAYLMLQRAKILAEPAGVTSVAAALFKKANLKGMNVVPVVSGGNINMQILEQIIEKGMVEEGLRACIRVIIPDQSGELKKILSIFEGLKVNIYDINHERSSSSVEVGKTLLTIKMNLQNKEQLKTIINMLKEYGLRCEIVS